MLGDIALAEPGTIVGFAGARVIEETIREKLPEGFQRAEYLLDHGMIDMVVPRHDLAVTLGRIRSCALQGTRRRWRFTESGRRCRLCDSNDGPAPASN